MGDSTHSISKISFCPLFQLSWPHQCPKILVHPIHGLDDHSIRERGWEALQGVILGVLHTIPEAAGSQHGPIVVTRKDVPKALAMVKRESAEG